MARTFARTSELAEMRWKEIDLENALWEINSQRMKRPSPHIFRFARQVVRGLHRLKDITGNEEWAFPSDWDQNKCMSEGTIPGR
jgi:integrase